MIEFQKLVESGMSPFEERFLFCLPVRFGVSSTCPTPARRYCVHAQGEPSEHGSEAQRPLN
jgi:hypothetical protein